MSVEPKCSAICLGSTPESIKSRRLERTAEARAFGRSSFAMPKDGALSRTRSTTASWKTGSDTNAASGKPPSSTTAAASE